MEASTSPSLPDSPLAAETRRLLLRLLAQHTPGMALANASVAIIFASMLWFENADTYIGYWLIFPLLINFARWRWNSLLRRQLPEMDAAHLHRTELIATAIIGLNGSAWGALAWIAYNGNQINVDFVTISVLVGMTGGAVTPLSALRYAFPLYAAAAVLPLLLKSLWIGGNTYIAGGLSLAVYLGILLSYGRTTHRTLRNAFKLQLEKDYLLQQLENMARSRSLFLAGVSHDLKQPVQALGMFNACLAGRAREENGVLGDELKRLAHGGGLALASINGQIGRLLELSQLEAGEIEPRQRRIQLADIYAYTRAQQAEKARQKGLLLRFAPTSLEVVSDIKMLQSICDNLVSNAVRYTESGHILVGSRRRGQTVEMQIWDTGPGIPADRIDQLFEAYRRFDDTADNAGHGVGLGLALVKKQADLLNHALCVRSIPGRGTVFSVILPRA
ncbi:MAG: HAMP domain-containing sensor histidine kinase [Thiobacillus sp.]|nr:HAMP domain-containing sensor histidine kinase [Thiobacillus sp.]